MLFILCELVVWGLDKKNREWGIAGKGKNGGLGSEAVWVEKRVSPLRSSQKRKLLRSK